MEDDQEICRVCTKSCRETDNLNTIFERPNLKGIMEECANINVDPDDGLPDTICVHCEKRFREAFELRNLAEKTDADLRKKLMPKPICAISKVPLTSIEIKLESELETSRCNTSQLLPEAVESLKSEPNINSDGFSSEDDTALSTFFVKNDVEVKTKDNSSESHSDWSDQMQEEPPKKRKIVRKFKKKSIKLDQTSSEATENPNNEEGVTAGEEPFEDQADSTTKKKRYYKRSVCPICGKTVSRISTHLKTHKTDDPFQCDICMKFLKSKAYLTTHKRLVHEKARKKCKHCDMLFWNNTTLRYHEQKVHMDSTESFQCNLCKNVFGHQETLNNHIKYHEYMQRKNGGKQIYFKTSLQCSACDFIYMTRAQFDAHLAWHNDRFACKFCDQVFKQNSTVAVHRKYNHKETYKNLQKTYFCDLCDYHTTHNFNLKRHQQWHQKKQ